MTTDLRLISIPNINGKTSILESYGSNIINDKVFFKFVPDLIKILLDEEVIIKQPETYWLNVKEEYDFVMQNPQKYVFKKRNSFGGLNTIIGNKMSLDELILKLDVIKEERIFWVAQEYIEMDKTPSILASNKINIQDLSYDFRPFVIIGEKIDVITGGISRIDISESGLVNVNSGGRIKSVVVLKGEVDDSL